MVVVVMAELPPGMGGDVGWEVVAEQSQSIIRDAFEDQESGWFMFFFLLASYDMSNIVRLKFMSYDMLSGPVSCNIRGMSESMRMPHVEHAPSWRARWDR